MATKPQAKKASSAKKKSKVKKLGLGHIYLLLASLFLTASSIFWTYLGADLHLENSDQLIIPYLFSDVGSLNAALLPSAHSFLIKWPFFYAVNFFSSAESGLLAMTIISSLLSVLGLAWALFKIEKRPVVLATIYISLASVLLLVPSVPASGQLIPVNMAMLATRNLEYMIYILCLWLFIRSKSYQSSGCWAGVLILALLIISDRLFMSLSLGGSLLASGVYLLNKKKTLLRASLLWLMGTIIASGLALIVISLISLAGATNLVSSRALGPYGFITSLQDLITGLIYSAVHSLTNLGANPALHTSVLADVPRSFIKGLLSFKGPAYIFNILLSVAAAVAIIKLSIKHFENKKNKKDVSDPYIILSYYLICSSASAIGAFILSNHYYAADARYLGIILFTAAITAAVYSRGINWRLSSLSIIGSVIALCACLAAPGVYKDYQSDKLALSAISTRNERIAEALEHHRVDVLVGDYWRVVPIKFIASEQVNILPLESCTTARSVLSSERWNVDLSSHSFAYLLSYDDSLTDYPQCRAADIVERYGSPNSSILLDGTFNRPLEQLLIYDNGARKKYPLTSVSTKGLETITPAMLGELPRYGCSRTEIMNIVAHQDDDLLFLNPDLALSIRSGHCVRTIYVTAGDAGANMYYWLNRQQGTQAAYSKMLGVKGEWADRSIDLGNNKYVVISNPLGNANISLIFMYLPDGNLDGQGFAPHKSSLARLNSNQIASIETVYTGTAYSHRELVDSLSLLMNHYNPAEIRTHSTQVNPQVADHSDHISVGQLVRFSYDAYKTFRPDAPAQLFFYQGYPVQQSPPNVEGDSLAIKEVAFLEYAKLDRGVCRNIEQCRRDPAYGAYLTRQYRSDK